MHFKIFIKNNIFFLALILINYRIKIIFYVTVNNYTINIVLLNIMSICY